MPDPQPDTQDSSAPIPYIDMGREGSSMPYMPESSGKKKSMDDLAGNINYDAILKADKGAVEEKIGRDKANDDAEKRRDEQYRSRQERMISAEGATMDDVKPWDAEKELAKHKTGLWEQFGSPGFIVSMLASAFTAQPMNSALTSGAAAMNAINQGDMEGYNKAFDAYKENTNIALKRIDLEKTQYEQIEKLRTSNMAEWRAQAEAIAARFNDTRMLTMLRGGADLEAMEVMDKMGVLRDHLSEAHMNLIKNKAREELFHQYDKDNPFHDQQKTIDNVQRAEAALIDPKTPDELAMKNLLTSDEYWKADFQGRQKLLNDAVAATSQAKRAGLNLTPTKEREIKERADEKQKANPEMPRAQAEDEAAREVTAARSTKGELTANKVADLTLLEGRYDEVEKTIDDVIDVISKTPAAAGLAGKTMRLDERVSNILGSDATKRTDVMRRLQILKTLAPRLLVGTSGRPVADEAERVNDTVPGLSIGDTQANTISGLKLLKQFLHDEGDNVSKVLHHQPAQATSKSKEPDQSWDDFPAVH